MLPSTEMIIPEGYIFWREMMNSVSVVDVKYQRGETQQPVRYINWSLEEVSGLTIKMLYFRMWHMKWRKTKKERRYPHQKKKERKEIGNRVHNEERVEILNSDKGGCHSEDDIWAKT